MATAASVIEARYNPLDNFLPLTESQLFAYLQRIRVLDVEPATSQEPSLALLNRILQAHAVEIPFENAEVLFLGAEVSLEPEDLVNKLVYERRGGYCFQHNTLLLCALLALGFNATFGSGRSSVWDDTLKTRVYGGLSHMIVFVDLPEGLYLADMGYNQIGLTQAIEIRYGATVESAAGEMHTIKHADVTGKNNFMLCHRRAEWFDPAEGSSEDGYADMVYFTLQRNRPQDLDIPNYYVSKSKKHILTRRLIVSKITETGGRVSLVDKKFRRRELSRDKDVSKEVENCQELRDLLLAEFGLSMSDAEFHSAQQRLFADASK